MPWERPRPRPEGQFNNCETLREGIVAPPLRPNLSQFDGLFQPVPPPRPSYRGDTASSCRLAPPPPPPPPSSSSSPAGVYRVRILKMRFATLGMAIEGGANTQQSWPRIIAIRPEGAAFQTGGQCLRVGQVIKEVDGRNLQGLPHEAVAKLMAERFARRDSDDMTLVVMDHIIKSGEKRKMRRYP